MGRVFLVADLLGGGQPVALKTLHREILSEKAVARFKEEFRAMTRLQHPNLAQVFDFDIVEETGEPFLTMEYLNGKDLSSFSPAELRPVLPNLIAQLVCALDYIHNRGVLHNDIKPQNIFLLPAPEGDSGSRLQAKLMDFGLAKLEGRSGSEGMSGTVHYTAPEVFRGEEVDARADLYSLGVVLFRLATGSLPFPGRDPGAVIRAHRESPPPSPRSLDPTLQEGMEKLILWLLEKNPRDRPGSAAAVLHALNQALGTDFVLETRETRESYLTGAVLVGREMEMEVLRSALRSLSSGGQRTSPEVEPRLILVGGESGAGKSRLLREFRYHAQTEGVQFLVGCCYETGGGVYQPFVEALRLLAPSVREDLQARDPDGLASLSALTLAPLFPDLFPPPDSDSLAAANTGSGKNRLFEAATQVLREIASRRPFVLALEDLHWADYLTIEFLHYLRDRSAGASFLIVVTYRDDEVAGRPLEALASRASTVGPQVVLRLRRLEVEQITRLVRSMLSLEEDPEELSLILQRQTAGNPFFIEEILKALVEESALQRSEGLWKVDLAHLRQMEVPRNVNEALSRRLSKLTDEERRLIRVLSVFNRPTSRALLARAGGWDVAQIGGRLTPLVSRGLLVRSEEGGQEKVAFAHAKTRDLVYRGLGAERTRLHLLAAELLEEASQSRSDEALEELAYHFLQGGAKAKGLEYAERAGDKCLRLYAYGAALEFFQKALSLLPRNQPRRRMEVFSKIGQVHTQAANYAEMQDYLNRALRIARSLGDRGREGHLIATVAYGHLLQGHFDLALRNSRAALAILEPLGDNRGMGRAKNFIATAYARLGQFDEATSYFVQALEHLEATNDLEQTVLVRGNLASVHLCKNRVEEGLKLFREALETWRQLGDKRGMALVMTNISQALKDLGRFGEAVETCEAAIRLHRETLERSNLAITLVSMAEIQMAWCAYDRAMRFAEESLQVRREIGQSFSVSHSLDLLGTGKRLSGDLEGAMELHQEGLRVARENKNELQEAFLLAALALDALEAGKGNEASLSAGKALVIGRRLRNRKIQAVALRVLVASALATGHLREASNRARDLDAVAVQGGSSEERCRALLALGSCRAAEAKLDEAERFLEEVLEVGRRLARIDLTAEARLALAAVAEKGGKPDKAEGFVRGAADELREIASRIEDSAVRRRFLASGSRPRVLDRPSLAVKAEGEHRPAVGGGSRVPPVKLLTTMYEISEMINTIRDPMELLNRVLDLAIQIVGAERGLIFLKEEATGELQVQVARNLERETIRDAGEYSHHILQEAEQGRSIISVDAGSDHRFEGYESVSLYNIRSLLCVPLRIRDRVLGTVYLDSRRPGVIFGGEDLEFLEAFANQAAIAIENARLYTALKEENLYLKKTVAARYGAVGIPTTFVIAPDGRIAYRFLGKTTAAVLATTLDRLIGRSG